MPWTADPNYDGDSVGDDFEVRLQNEPYGDTALTIDEFRTMQRFTAKRTSGAGTHATRLDVEISVHPTTATEALMQAVPGSEPITSAEELLERFEDGKLDSLVQDCVDRLPSQEREAFLLGREGNTERQIAAALGVSQPTAHRLIKRAQKTLQSEISVHPVYVERHLAVTAPNRNATRPADHAYIEDCRKIQKLLNLGTANARWRVARILFDLRRNGAPMDKVAQVTYLSPLTIDSLADEFANG